MALRSTFGDADFQLIDGNTFTNAGLASTDGAGIYFENESGSVTNNTLSDVRRGIVTVNSTNSTAVAEVELNTISKAYVGLDITNLRSLSVIGCEDPLDGNIIDLSALPTGAPAGLSKTGIVVHGQRATAPGETLPKISFNTITCVDSDTAIVAYDNVSTADCVQIVNNSLTASGTPSAVAGESTGIFVKNESTPGVFKNNRVGIVGNSITGFNTGIQVHGNHPAGTTSVFASITGNNSITLSAAATGIRIFDAAQHSSTTKAEIIGNAATITGQLVGIEIDGASADVFQNSLNTNGTGIRLLNGGLFSRAQQNFITGNNKGVVFESTASASSAPIFNNDLSGNTTLAVRIWRASSRMRRGIGWGWGPMSRT